MQSAIHLFRHQTHRIRQLAHKSVAATALLVLFATAAAKIHKEGRMTDHGIHLYWWPELRVPKGWVHDEDDSLDLTSNVLIPKGATFQNAPSLIYARAFYVPDEKKSERHLRSFIRDDQAPYRRKIKTFRVAEIKPGWKTADGRILRTFRLSYIGTQEVVCYGSEGDYWLVFVITSKSSSALDRDLPTFREVVEAYR